MCEKDWNETEDSNFCDALPWEFEVPLYAGVLAVAHVSVHRASNTSVHYHVEPLIRKTAVLESRNKIKSLIIVRVVPFVIA